MSNRIHRVTSQTFGRGSPDIQSPPHGCSYGGHGTLNAGRVIGTGNVLAAGPCIAGSCWLLSGGRSGRQRGGGDGKLVSKNRSAGMC